MTDPRRKDKQKAEGRRSIVASCYRRGMTITQTCEVVMKELGLEKPPSRKAVFNDRHALIAEWRSERVEDMDHLLQLELSRIDDIIIELWAAWEKSKEDYKATFKKQKGSLPAGVGKDRRKVDQAFAAAIQTTDVERGEKDVINFGDPRYLAEIRMQLAERRKLLGLYAPEKKELTGKDGSDLIPTAKYDLTALSAEEKAELLKIARKVERTE